MKLTCNLLIHSTAPQSHSNTPFHSFRHPVFPICSPESRESSLVASELVAVFLACDRLIRDFRFCAWTCKSHALSITDLYPGSPRAELRNQMSWHPLLLLSHAQVPFSSLFGSFLITCDAAVQLLSPWSTNCTFLASVDQSLDAGGEVHSRTAF